MIWNRLDSRKITVVDLETTGFSPTENEIIEVAVVDVAQGQIVNEWSTLIKPRKPVPLEVTRIHGITNDMLMLAPRKGRVLPTLREKLSGSFLIEHNQNYFDSAFIKAFIGEEIWEREINTLHMARQIISKLEHYDLKTLCSHCSISLESHHSALDDAIATANLFIYLINEAEKEKRYSDYVNSVFGL